MKAPANSHITLTRHFFSDHQEFGAMVNERFGVDFASIQLSNGSGSYHMDCIEVPAAGIWVARTKPSQAEYSEFEIPRGYVMVSACRKNTPVFSSGVRVGFSSIFVYPAGKKFRAMYPKGWDGLDLLIKIEQIEKFGLVSRAIVDSLEDGTPCISTPCGREAHRFLDRLAGYFDSAAAAKSAMQHKSIATKAIDFVITQLREVLDGEFLHQQKISPDTTRRADIVDRATDYIESNIGRDVLAEDVAKSLGVSYRLLGYAFQDALDVSPYQFILIKKLHAVREQLKESPEPVNAVADCYGFTTPSRFRKQYSRLFGELPSQTRQRYSRLLQ